MDKIAVMGDYDSIYGFAALGLSIFPDDGSDREESVRTLRNLAAHGFGVIYLTEGLAEILQDVVEEFRTSMLPAIILIPGVKGNSGAGVRAVKKSVEQAVGSDILFGES